jgi:hypothetical protein
MVESSAERIDQAIHFLLFQYLQTRKLPEVSEILSVPLDPLIVFAKESFRAAEGVFEPLIENPGEHEREELVP